MNSDAIPTPRAEDEAPDGAQAEVARSLGEIGLTNFAPYLMNRIMGRYNRTLREALGAEGLTVAKARALAILSVIDGLKVNELAVYAVVEQSTLSRTLDAMEAEGLIRRSVGEADSRARHIHLTEEGRALNARVWPHMSDAYEQMFVGIEAEERDAVVRTLQKMLRNVRQHDI
jgi:DNA-binding MarR family transcriptional regulator